MVLAMTVVAGPTEERADPPAPEGAPRPVRKSTFAGTLMHPIFLTGGVLVFVLSFLLPEGGIGAPLCWFKLQSGLPCPGCGLTRSVTAAGHFDPVTAFHYHPFGLFVWLLAGFLSANVVIGTRAREAIRDWLIRRSRVVGISAWVALFAFLVYGFVRFGLAAAYPESFAYL
jgi:hypothetical protein